MLKFDGRVNMVVYFKSMLLGLRTHIRKRSLDYDAEILPEDRAIFEESFFVGRTKRSAVPAIAGQFCSANVES